MSFSVPQLSLESVGAILESLRINREGLRYALVVHAGFKLRDAEVHGYLVIVLSVASLDRMLRAVEEWEQPRPLMSERARHDSDLLDAAFQRWFQELADRGIFTTDCDRRRQDVESLARGADRHRRGPGGRAVAVVDLVPSLVDARAGQLLPRRHRR